VVLHRGREFVLADIPGLIEGAAEGAGVGDRFLGHVERCRVLLHLVDASGEDPLAAWAIVREELDAYGAGLTDKPEVVALSKADAVDGKALAALRKRLAKASGSEVLVLSAATGEGVDVALDALVAAIGTDDKAPAEQEEATWRPL
jgi:GTP-binding protein